MGCFHTGPGRGDCEHFIGMPSVVDGTTTDVYGKPHGWCWTCWRVYQLRRNASAIRAAVAGVGAHFDALRMAGLAELRRQTAAAVAEEREACAVIAEATVRDEWETGVGWQTVTDAIAAAIRARG